MLLLTEVLLNADIWDVFVSYRVDPMNVLVRIPQT